MTDQELSAKEAHFYDQVLLDLSDDEQDFPNESFEIMERALADSKALPSSEIVEQASRFLGPTPKERQTKFETHTSKQRASERQKSRKLVRSSTMPGSGTPKNAPLTRSRSRLPPSLRDNNRKKAKIVSSPPRSTVKNQTPFYKQTGAVPRELKSGKNVKPANNIKLEPEHKQLLKNKLIYFFPNDDVSLTRRTRIHKVIQLGAAWVNRLRDDVTHIMIDDSSYTYSQLLRHLNMAGLPVGSPPSLMLLDLTTRKKHVILVKFDPYIPQCIQFGVVLDPTSQRFAVQGAPQRTQPIRAIGLSQSPAGSQVSVQITSSGLQASTKGSQETSLHKTEKYLASNQQIFEISLSQAEERVEDTFTISSPEPIEHLASNGTSHFDDALSQAIRETKALSHLPLDEDEDTESPTTTPLDQSDGSGIDEEPFGMDLKPPKRLNIISKASALRDKTTLDLNAFQCMDPGANRISPSNPNARTIQILEEMCKHYDQMQDTWRTLAYRKGITTLKKQPVKITSARQAAALPFIGSRLAKKIEEIVLTDRLRKLENTRDDPLDVALRLFLGVYGAGLVQANKWIQAGHRTLDDLRTKAKLIESHIVGIEHYDDFNSRIPRAEVESHGTVVKEALRKIDNKFQATIMGSYRRGAKDSGDIDLIITKPGANLATLRTIVFDELVPLLYKQGFLKASLATSRSNDPSGTTWHGASCLPESNVWRRMDLLLVPEEELGAALLYFTGNDIFNRSIRLLARKKNMRLNQRGLYKDVKRGRRGEKLNEGILVEGRCEKKIFELLGVPWREPHERIC